MRTPWCTLTRASLSGTRAAVRSRFWPMVSPSSGTGLAPCTYEGSLATSTAASFGSGHARHGALLRRYTAAPLLAGAPASRRHPAGCRGGPPAPQRPRPPAGPGGEQRDRPLTRQHCRSPDSGSGWWPRPDPWRAAIKATITVVVSGCGSRDDASVGTDGGREALRYEHVIAAQVVDAAPAEGEQGGVGAIAQDVEDVDHAGLAVRGQAPQVGAADHDGAGAEGEGFDDVAAAANAAVQQDLDPVAH